MRFTKTLRRDVTYRSVVLYSPVAAPRTTRANSAQMRQSRPYSGLGLSHFEATRIEIGKVVPLSRGRTTGCTRAAARLTTPRAVLWKKVLPLERRSFRKMHSGSFWCDTDLELLSAMTSCSQVAPLSRGRTTGCIRAAARRTTLRSPPPFWTALCSSTPFQTAYFGEATYVKRGS